MSAARTVVTLALLVACFVYCEAQEKEKRCRCEIFWTRDSPGRNQRTHRLAYYGIEDSTLTAPDCKQYSLDCLDACIQKLQTEFQAIHLGTRYDPRFKLGKMLCTHAGVAISALRPRPTFIRTNVPGCGGDSVENFIEVGNLCCYQCLNSQNVLEITYNPDCNPYYFPPGRCDM